jgi:hypothetical protein
MVFQCPVYQHVRVKYAELLESAHDLKSLFRCNSNRVGTSVHEFMSARVVYKELTSQPHNAEHVEAKSSSWVTSCDTFSILLVKKKKTYSPSTVLRIQPNESSLAPKGTVQSSFIPSSENKKGKGLRILGNPSL